jgi:hypothetical protein
MKFAYEDQSDEQFETLVVLLCKRLFGVAVQGFAAGPDGGRDGKFVGTAELFPSKASPWVGTTIIQAKHTNGLNRNFSESDFYNPNAKKSILGDELPRIKKLREGKKLDHYILFSNRRLAGNAESEISEYLANGAGIPVASVYLCGVEQLELWLKDFSEVPKLANLDPIDSPLMVSPDDLSEIVQALARQKDEMSKLLDKPPVPRVSFEEKNRINSMSADYAKLQRKKYLKDTAQICTFLAAPENIELQRMYESVVDEFQLKITSKRKDYQTFDEVMEYLIDVLFGRDPILRQHGNKKLTRAMLFYMYWNCDIGEVNDAEAI